MGIIVQDIRDDYFWPGSFASESNFEKYLIGDNYYGTVTMMMMMMMMMITIHTYDLFLFLFNK